ncbi:MAG: hypothetical protein J3Q66DRAFT_406973 [Benniella sp.]|nr:MAG: hypothetical protein J3Q66DRAFT_406973 [Benniella sp.]
MAAPFSSTFKSSPTPGFERGKQTARLGRQEPRSIILRIQRTESPSPMLLFETSAMIKHGKTFKYEWIKGNGNSIIGELRYRKGCARLFSVSFLSFDKAATGCHQLSRPFVDHLQNVVQPGTGKDKGQMVSAGNTTLHLLRSMIYNWLMTSFSTTIKEPTEIQAVKGDE